MNLPKCFFEPETYKLTGNAKNSLKKFLKNQELSRTNLVGYTPNPENPCPPRIWPWPRNINNMQSNFGDLIGPPWPEPCGPLSVSNFGNLVYPDPNDINPWPWPWPIGPLVKDLINERVYELISKSPIRANTYDFIDVIKRENIAVEALSELNKNLSEVQNIVAVKLKKLS